MVTHSIPGAKKAVCTAEQFIAYNIAVTFSENDFTAEELIERFYPTSLKYNVDAVMVALRSGLYEYRKRPFIATDYAQVGKVFALKV